MGATATGTAMAPGPTDRQLHWWLFAWRVGILFRLRVQWASLDNQRAHFLDVEYGRACPDLLLLRQIPIQDLSTPACRTAGGSRYPGLPVLQPVHLPPLILPVTGLQLAAEFHLLYHVLQVLSEIVQPPDDVHLFVLKRGMSVMSSTPPTKP